MFGGSKNIRQISRVEGCNLKRLGSLAFDFYYGTCTTFDSDQLFLCFPETDKKGCRKGNDPQGKFSRLTPSRYDHFYTRIALTNGNLKLLKD